MTYELPLFPLNTVLFPGMPLPLHIFEDRYKQMIHYCLEQNTAFGVLLVREGAAEGESMARPHLIGCTAEIAQVEELDEGRLLIMTIGRERFRVVQLHHDNPYMVGTVEPAPLIEDLNAAPVSDVTQLDRLVREYLEILTRTGHVDFDAAQIPSEPIPLSYLAATIIQLPMICKQHLLDINNVTQLIKKLLSYYRNEIMLMRTMPTDDQAPFSLN